MGGWLILLSTVVPLVLWIDIKNPLVVGTVFITWGFGLIGYLDDYLKVSKKNSKGLSGKIRLLGEFLISGAVILILIEFYDLNTNVGLPFIKNLALDLDYWYVAFGALVIVGTANAVNLTDGLDGLQTVDVVGEASEDATRVVRRRRLGDHLLRPGPVRVVLPGVVGPLQRVRDPADLAF